MSADDADSAARNAAARLANIEKRRQFPGYPAPSEALEIAHAQVEALLAIYGALRYGSLTVTSYTVQP